MNEALLSTVFRGHGANRMSEAFYDKMAALREQMRASHREFPRPLFRTVCSLSTKM